MQGQFDLNRLSVHQFAERFRAEMIPLSNTFSYFCASVPMTEEDLKEYLQEPVAALPPSIAAALPKITILLVPYLERANGAHGKSRVKTPESDFVSIEKPPLDKLAKSAQVKIGDETVLAFALKDQEVAEYHYLLYHLLAAVMGDRWTEEVESTYGRVIREELNAEAHGEVDEPSWRLKQTLRRGTNARSGSLQNSRAFRDYARQSFIDTLTLYLHGICCDIDVDTGPRQLPSRFLRKRLMALEKLYPPPSGYAVFPEQLEP